ncbi:MAG: type II toxin-antitoxin system VapC family toxin [Spirochaetes bacterium]|nr:type II toxin-antitoxin system VapC family toxin [Spirochaetota bacterium]
MILIDTHVCIWWIQESTDIPKDVKTKIKSAQKRNNIFISSISIWEIAMLIKYNRLTLTVPLSEWIKKLESVPYFKFIPVDNAIAEHSVNLPGEFHKDPADRIIVATSRIHNIPLITSDEKILNYPYVKTIWK